MIEEFRTNPGCLKMKGNIIGEDIGELSSLSDFEVYKAAVSSDTQITEDGKTFNVAKMVYSD